MARIQSNVGLTTGIPIQETVDSLMKVAARPRNLLKTRTEAIQSEQVAVTELTGLLYSIKTSVERLGQSSLFSKRTATSSNTSALSATVSGDPAEGTYRLTPLRTAQGQQLLSSGFAAADEPIGAGTLRFRYGDHVERGTPLDLLGDGTGLTRGSMRITDRSGAEAEIDLSAALSIDDVLDAINQNTTIAVTAVAHGDAIRLVDNTGETASNLKVEEIGGGTTAASLGLDAIDAAADTADGSDVLRLYDDLDLDQLNDGSGVRIDTVLDDIEYTLRDGTTGAIDLSPIVSGSSEVDHDRTLGELIERINAAEPGKLEAAIGPDGDRLVVTDLTSGAGSFTLTSAGTYDVLADLGIDGAALDGEITGRRILGGVRSVLLSSLGGGDGLGDLGSIDLTDRSGATATVDLSAAETLEEVVDQINTAGLGITADVNSARIGIKLTDTTGATASNLIVASAEATSTAETLGIAVDDAVTQIDGGDLSLQVVATNTELSDLNGGKGVSQGTLIIRDSSGGRTTINVGSSIETVGDLITEINRQADDVRAEINETGDGIRIVDLGDGTSSLVVEEGTGNTAADLRLLGEATEIDVDGELRQVVDGSLTYTVELDADSTLEDLRDAISDLGAGVNASILTASSSKPYHLALASQRAGRQGQLVFDTSQLDFSLTETTEAEDALLVYGDVGSPGANLLLTSETNTFSGAVPGVNLTIGQPSDMPVTVTVSTTDSDLLGTVRTMVNGYNKFRQRLLDLTEFDTATNTGSVLTGDAAALRLDVDLPNLLSRSFDGAGAIRSLAELGIDMEKDGTLSLDETQLSERFAANPQSVKDFFTTEDRGFSARFEQLIEQLAGEESSLLSARIEALGDTIERNQQRMDEMQELLDIQRERMLMDFYRMELAVGKMQTMMTALESVKALPPITISRNSNRN